MIRFDFDWERFTGLQMVSVVSFISLIGLIAIGLSSGSAGVFYWIALAANVAVAFFGIFFVLYPRKDGSWRGIGE